MSALCHSRRSLGSFIFVKLAAVGNFEQIEGKIRSYKIYCKGGISGNIQLLDLPLVMLRPQQAFLHPKAGCSVRDFGCPSN